MIPYLYRRLVARGVPHATALKVSTPGALLAAAPVADPAGLTSTTVDAPNPGNAPTLYDSIWANVVVNLVRENKDDTNALRADVEALNAKVTELLTALREAGLIND